MSNAFNLVAEILLIRTYDLGLADQTMKDSSFQVMWVVGFEPYQYVSGKLLGPLS
jgi:hypothetical protein